VVRPDQDAAGRLLEGASNRPPRGMTVRTRFASDRTRLTGCTSQEPAFCGDSTAEGRLSFHLMPIPANRSAMAAIALIMACTPTGSGLPPVTPIPPTTVGDTGARTVMTDWTLLPGRFEYSLTQTSRVHRPATTDTLSAAIQTTARLLIDVTPTNDSTYAIEASIDSLQMVTEGLTASRVAVHPSFLGPVLRASLGPEGNRVESSLPDSLCAYGQLVILAREVLLPQLATQLAHLSGMKTDTTRVIVCRAGTRIEVLVTRQISDSGTGLSQVNLQGTAELKGSGILGRDSVAISGSITTRGTASLTGGSRLPSIVQTESDGLITVRVGDSTSVFRQTSSQRLEQRTAPGQPSTPPR
jgi:hypothetical protein